MAKAEARYILGSEGKPDYLVVGWRSNIVLGIKPVFGWSSQTEMFVGLRFRSTHDPNPKAPEENDGVIKFEPLKTIVTAWPKITFEKVDMKRASIMIVNKITPPDEEWPTICSAVRDPKRVEAMGAMVVDLCGDSLVVSPEEVQEFYLETWGKIEKAVGEAMAQQAAAKEQHVPKQQDKPADVLEFPSTKLVKAALDEQAKHEIENIDKLFDEQSNATDSQASSEPPQDPPPAETPPES